jgi:trypsin
MKRTLAKSVLLSCLAATTSSAAVTQSSFIVGGNTVEPGDYPYFGMRTSSIRADLASSYSSRSPHTTHRSYRINQTHLTLFVLSLVSSFFCFRIEFRHNNNNNVYCIMIIVEMGGCGGALVAADTVLFAAHCGVWKDKQISIGAYKTRSTDNGAEGRFCEEWIPDPLYNNGGGFNNHDFALCKLDKPLEIDQSRVRLELNDDELFPSDGEDLEVMGFGWLDLGRRVPDFLQYVTVPSVSNDVCKSVFGDIFTTDTMLCAGYFDRDGKDACKGDSGGPLVQRAIKNDGTIVDTHVGVVSYGVPCANAGIPTVYARTSSRIDWIKTTMCNDLRSVAPFCNTEKKKKNSNNSECDGENLTIEITTDDFGRETYWTLQDSSNNRVKKREYFINNLEYETNVCLRSDECYTWELHDRYGDGMCTSRGCGSYTFTLNGKQLFSADGNFRFSKTESFCTKPSTSTNSNLPKEPPSEVCKDSESFRWKDRKSLTCQRLLRAKKLSLVRRRCQRTWQDILVSEWCPETCGKKVQEGPCPTLQIRK